MITRLVGRGKGCKGSLMSVLCQENIGYTRRRVSFHKICTILPRCLSENCTSFYSLRCDPFTIHSQQSLQPKSFQQCDKLRAFRSQVSPMTLRPSGSIVMQGSSWHAALGTSGTQLGSVINTRPHAGTHGKGREGNQRHLLVRRNDTRSCWYSHLHEWRSSDIFLALLLF